MRNVMRGNHGILNLVPTPRYPILAVGNRAETTAGRRVSQTLGTRLRHIPLTARPIKLRTQITIFEMLFVSRLIKREIKPQEKTVNPKISYHDGLRFIHLESDCFSFPE